MDQYIDKIVLTESVRIDGILCEKGDIVFLVEEAEPESIVEKTEKSFRARKDLHLENRTIAKGQRFVVRKEVPVPGSVGNLLERLDRPPKRAVPKIKDIKRKGWQ